MQLEEKHNHDGINSSRINPIHVLSLPLYSTVPAVGKAPSFFIYVNGATKRFYVKHGTTLSYVVLT